MFWRVALAAIALGAGAGVADAGDDGAGGSGRNTITALGAVVQGGVPVRGAIGVHDTGSVRGAAAVCNGNPAAAGTMARLRDTMAHGRFISYQPTSLQVLDGKPTHADSASIRADLTVLRPRFDALITYSSVNGAEQVPGIAASLGFRAVVIGVWDPFNRQEMDAAVTTASAHADIVVGLSLGNEMVFTGRHSFADLATLTKSVHKRLPWLLVSTTEPFHMYYQPAAVDLLGSLDFLLVNVHPVFQPWFRKAPDGDAAQFVVNVVTKLGDDYCGPILVKETGVPTAPVESGFTPQRQVGFFAELQARFPPSGARAFAYFSAFDAPWRARDQLAAPGENPNEDASANTGVSANATPTMLGNTTPPHANPKARDRLAEAYWGLFDQDRRPKPVVARIAPLTDVSRRDVTDQRARLN